MEWGHGIARSLIETDCRYFELGAVRVEVPHAQMWVVPGMGELAAACVVQRVDVPAVEPQPGPWGDAIEAAFDAHAVVVRRVYLTEPAPLLERELRGRGYRSGVEVGYAVLGPKPPPLLDVALRPVETPADWDAKARLHSGPTAAPDGHVVDGARWLEIERLKCETGEMEPFLIVRDQQVVGAVNVMRTGSFLRLKNLVVAAEHRSTGCGRAAARLVEGIAAQRGCSAVGCFAIRGEAGERAYAGAGYRQAGVEQVEWSREVKADSSVKVTR